VENIDVGCFGNGKIRKSGVDDTVKTLKQEEKPIILYMK
jgi:hypothetical protein